MNIFLQGYLYQILVIFLSFHEYNKDNKIVQAIGQVQLVVFENFPRA